MVVRRALLEKLFNSDQFLILTELHYTKTYKTIINN